MQQISYQVDNVFLIDFTYSNQSITYISEGFIVNISFLFLQRPVFLSFILCWVFILKPASP